MRDHHPAVLQRRPEARAGRGICTCNVSWSYADGWVRDENYDYCPTHGRARNHMGMAQCSHRKPGGAARCGLAPNHPGDCKFGDNPRRDGDTWVYTDAYGDTIRLEPASSGLDDVYLSVSTDGSSQVEIRKGDVQVEIRKGDVQAFADAVLEVASRPPKCTRCGGSGKEPR